MNNFSNIFQIVARDEPRIFTLAEAQALFPLVRSITQASYAELDPVRQQLAAMIPSNPQIHAVEKLYETIALGNRIYDF